MPSWKNRRVPVSSINNQDVLLTMEGIYQQAGKLQNYLFFSLPDDYKSELREQLPLIAGSAAAGVVFIVSLVAISIVCSRYYLPH